jgi:ribose 1,5-bisphosphokinase
MAGRLILVVGPSGAGKDTLLAAAADALADVQDITFPLRMVTREAHPEAEDHLTLSESAFERMVAEDDYTLSWRAHGHGYLVPKSVAEAVAGGVTAVCNVSRAVIQPARERYPETGVILVTADKHIRAMRLSARGRETTEQIEARLTREAASLPADVTAVEIDNSGDLTQSVRAFVGAIEQLAGLPAGS